MNQANHAAIDMALNARCIEAIPLLVSRDTLAYAQDKCNEVINSLRDKASARPYRDALARMHHYLCYDWPFVQSDYDQTVYAKLCVQIDALADELADLWHTLGMSDNPEANRLTMAQYRCVRTTMEKLIAERRETWWYKHRLNNAPSEQG